jgi:hypothetical protein
LPAAANTVAGPRRLDIDVAGELFWGDDRLEDAAAHVRSVGRAA